MAKIKITQTGSPIRRDKTQRATLVGLGLNKLRRTVEVEGTPEVLGQVRKVPHLVRSRKPSSASPRERDAGAILLKREAGPSSASGRGTLRDKSESECTT